MQKPDPRFEKYEEVYNSSGKAIGFRLPDNTFIFKYEQDGGWYDQKGRYFDHEGILLQEAPDLDEIHGDDQEYLGSDQQQILDQFEQMLAEQEQGIIRKKHSLPKQVENKEQSRQQNQEQHKKIDYFKESQVLVKKYAQGTNVRQGLPKQLVIFFKMKEQFFIKVKPQVQGCKSTEDQNKQVKLIIKEIDEQKSKIKQCNKWISDQSVQLQFSGNCIQENQYKRYWYGRVKTTPQKFMDIWSQIKQSKQFSILEHKTYYALKSRFYEKEKMKKMIEQMIKTAEKFQQNQLIEVTLANLPELFPISFVIDLFDLAGLAYQEIISIKIIDQFSANATLTKAGAIAISNLEGYCHETSQYVQIEMSSLKKQVGDKKGWFNVKLDSEYKLNYAQLYDCMAIEQSKTGVVKHYPKGEKYRWVIDKSFLKRISMFRGPTVDIEQLKQLCSQKDIV